MVKAFKVVALAGALAFVAAPAFAQDLGLPLVGQLPVVGDGAGGLDLDPFHIFTPAPEAAAAAPAPMMKKHHMMMHHKKMMMHHKMMKKAM